MKHEEADTRIVWHIADVAQTMADPSFTVRSSNTDILIILMYHVNINSTILTRDVGNIGQNNKRYIDVKDNLGSEIPGMSCITRRACIYRVRLHCYHGQKRENKRYYFKILVHDARLKSCKHA